MRLADSLTQVLSPMDSFEVVGAQFDKLSNAAVHEVLVENLRLYSNYLQATVRSYTSEQQSPDMAVQISTVATSRSFTETTISNYLRVLHLSCIYSQ